MDKQQKTLKSPLSEYFDEIKAKAAGEAQKSLAREVLSRLEVMETPTHPFSREQFFWLKDLLKQIIG